MENRVAGRRGWRMSEGRGGGREAARRGEGKVCRWGLQEGKAWRCKIGRRRRECGWSTNEGKGGEGRVWVRGGKGNKRRGRRGKV